MQNNRLGFSFWKSSSFVNK